MFWRAPFGIDLSMRVEAMRSPIELGTATSGQFLIPGSKIDRPRHAWLFPGGAVASRTSYRDGVPESDVNVIPKELCREWLARLEELGAPTSKVRLRYVDGDYLLSQKFEGSTRPLTASAETATIEQLGLPLGPGLN
jgi:hypothetical protein